MDVGLNPSKSLPHIKSQDLLELSQAVDIALLLGCDTVLSKINLGLHIVSHELAKK